MKLYFIRSLPRVSFWFSSISLPNLVGCLAYASCFSFPLSILFALLLNICPLFYGLCGLNLVGYIIRPAS